MYAARVREAMAGSIDTGKLAEAWVALHPSAVPQAAKALPELKAFLGRARQAIQDALSAVLPRLWTEAWVLGNRSALAAVDSLADVDWGGWTPGDYAAAEQIAGPGLRQLLGEQGIRIKSIADSRLEELSAVLEATLRSDEITREPGTAPLPPFLSVQDLAGRLRTVLDNPERAELVAQAEIARAQATAARQVYAETGRTEVEVSTAEDDRVCPVCDAAAALGAHPLGAPPLVPLHPRCFPAGTLVSGPRAVAATSRHYEGDLVTVVFAAGDELPVTPNHPVLTPSGWVAAGDLQKGDRVFRARDGIERALACPDDEQVVARIEDVAGTLAEAVGVTSVRMPVAAEDFHGDGSPGHDVDVVSAARRTERQVDAAECEDGADLAFVGRSGLTGLGKGDRDPLGVTGAASPAGGMGSVEHGGAASLVGALPAQPHGFRSVAGRRAGLAEHALDGPAADAVTLGKFLDGIPGEEVGGEAVGDGEPLPVLPDAGLADLAVGDGDADASDGRALADALAGLVSLDQVRDLRRVSWSGHVYNLETVDGWYFANGIIAHNCRCAELPVLELT